MTATRYDEINKIWFGPENTFQVDSTRNFAEIILEKLTADDPERVMQVRSDDDDNLHNQLHIHFVLMSA